MRLKVERISLLGAVPLPFDLGPGMNAIVGPIHSGKTSLWRLMRFSIGAGWPAIVTPEMRQFVKSIDARIALDGGYARVLRQFVSTDTALVNVDFAGETQVLPAREPTSLSAETYAGWMLNHLGLPSVQVRQRRRDPESPLIPLSLSDFLEWCFLEQDVLERGLFNASEGYLEAKRRYVFEYIYQLSDTELSRAEAELSEVLNQLGVLQQRYQVIRQFLSNADVVNLAEARRRLIAIEDERNRIIGDRVPGDSSPAQEVRSKVLALDAELNALEGEARAEDRGVQDLRTLAAQLTTQVARVNRAILAGSALVDFDFVECPRCGQDLPSREASACSLCGQPDRPTLDVGQLREEQRRLQGQLEETRGLVDLRSQAVEQIRQRQSHLVGERGATARRLEELTSRYVSDRQETLESQARRLGEIDAERVRYTELERMYAGLENLTAGQEDLSRRRAELEALIDRKRAERAQRRDVFRELETIMTEVLERIGLQPFRGTAHNVEIDRSTYEPQIEGRTFESLSSGGLRVVVNLAHAIAHHIYAGRHHDSALPRLLVIDSPRKNLGHYGYDTSVGDRLYELFIELGETSELDTQVVIFDGGVPTFAAEYIRQEFDEEHRLFPLR